MHTYTGTERGRNKKHEKENFDTKQKKKVRTEKKWRSTIQKNEGAITVNETKLKKMSTIIADVRKYRGRDLPPDRDGRLILHLWHMGADKLSHRDKKRL